MDSDSSRGSSPERVLLNPREQLDDRKAIDKNLPPLKRVSLRRWSEMWSELCDDNNQSRRDAFALTGHFTDINGAKCRAQLDLTSVKLRAHQIIYQVCDIDSVIGVVTDDFPILPGAVLQYYMLQSPSHTLSTNLHIPAVSVIDENSKQKGVFLHEVPNARFIEMEPRATIRIFFPLLARPPGQNNCVKERSLEQLYDLAVQPAAMTTMPEEIRRKWPKKYGDEKWRAEAHRRADGANEGPAQGRSVQQSGRDIHVEHLNEWVTRIREIVGGTAELHWARSFFFAVEMRGLKEREVSIHAPPEVCLVNEAGEIDDEHNPRTLAVDGLFECFDTTRFPPGMWFLDIATTVTVSDDDDGPSACTFASADIHADMISHLVGASWEQCRRWVDGHGAYYSKDEVAHLGDVAGFRFNNPKPEGDGVHYVQVYTSEKSLTYNLNVPGHAKRTSPLQVLNNWDRAREDHFIPLEKAFMNSSATHSVALRIESRVDFYSYPKVHLRIPEDLLRHWLYSINNSIFWGFKHDRLCSIYSVLGQWIGARKTFTDQILPEAGSLLILLTWMANALVNRPDDGGTWDEVRDSGCVHDMVDGRLVARRPLGAYNLHSLYVKTGRLPRISSLRTVSNETILYLLSTAGKPVINSMDAHELIAQPQPPAQALVAADPWGHQEVVSQDAAPYWVPNKQRMVNVMSSERPADQFVDLIPEPERVERYASEDEDFEERQQHTPRSQLLTNILHSYPIQIMAKAPNKKRVLGCSSESWCHLDMEERGKIKFSMFSSMDDLEKAFKCYVSFGYDRDKWDQTVKILIPTLDDKKKRQGVDAIKVRRQFQQLLMPLSLEERANVVREAREYVSRHWVWLPYGGSKDHLWATGSSGHRQSCTIVGPVKGGPWIVLNPDLTVRPA